MRHLGPTRLLLVVALAVPSTTLAAALPFAQPASARGAVVTCKHLKGDILTVSLTGCSDFGNTGGSGILPMTDPNATITWATGLYTTMTFGGFLVSQDETERYSCPTGSTEFQESGTVTADATGSIPVGSTFSVELCVIPTNVVVNEKGSKPKIK